MQTYFANQSCDPFTDRSVPCTLGNYVSYAVDVNCHSDIALALRFAKENNLRVVVRNTGHEYVGHYILSYSSCSTRLDSHLGVV